LTAALEKALNAKEHQQKAEQISLEPLVMKGDRYRKFLKDNEQRHQEADGLVTRRDCCPPAANLLGSTPASLLHACCRAGTVLPAATAGLEMTHENRTVRSRRARRTPARDAL
jgi:hypothetical protein